MRRAVLCGVMSVTLLLVAAQGVGAVGKPVAVSPGSATGALVADRCPTFSWGGSAGAQGYELVVYRIGENRKAAEPVLRESFVGSVGSWTPSLGRCLERGGRYAWSVRAVGEREAPGWSAPRLFQVAAGPTEAQFEEALQLVRQYIEAPSGEGAKKVAGTPAESESESEAEATASSPGPRVVGTTQLSVDGGIEAISFTGDGSTLTDLDPANLAAGTAVISISGTAATASNLACTDCISESELDFDTATQGELDTHAVGNPDAHHSSPTGFPHDCRWRVVKATANSVIADCEDVGTGYHAVAGGCYGGIGATFEDLTACFPLDPDGVRYGDGAETQTYPVNRHARGWWGRWTNSASREVAALCCNW